MEPPPSTYSPTSAGRPGDAEKLRHLPADAQEAFRRFRETGNPAALDPVILAILEDLIPHTPAQPLAAMPGSTRLIDELRFDSLSITEVVFFMEDLFGIM